MKKENLLTFIILALIFSAGIGTGLGAGAFFSQSKGTPTTTSVINLAGEKYLMSKDTTSDQSGLVPVLDYDESFVIDLRYSTTNNFTGKKIYPVDTCLLQKGTLDKLINANNDFKKLGYKIKIWDAYRPASVQVNLWNLVKDRRFIASPYVSGSRHNRGAAVDITLVDSTGKELEMPTGFDEFNTSAYRTNTNISDTAKKNLELLTSVMEKNGFDTIETEWWHYDDSEADNYPILDIPLEDF
ncbi:M15 family metallopeptidase [Clostridium sp. YIM B02551]|uniref:M15 family metallopeptidase n=1 Tax=Clostridium sp. YIM B02551 TaxID=2910679 RepID=UPI001EEB273F